MDTKPQALIKYIFRQEASGRSVEIEVNTKVVREIKPLCRTSRELLIAFAVLDSRHRLDGSISPFISEMLNARDEIRHTIPEKP